MKHQTGKIKALLFLLLITPALAQAAMDAHPDHHHWWGLYEYGSEKFPGQTTLDGSNGNTTRIGVLMYYGF